VGLLYPANDKTMAAGYPVLLGGTIDGYVLQLGTGGTDRGSPIDLEVEGARWNPFVTKGLRARLGYIDFLVDRDPNIQVTVDFFIDSNVRPYKTETLVCDGPADEEKVWKRLYCGTVGNFHKIYIHHTASNQTPNFHAVVPYFKPVGRLI